jgi:hypothetical protein
MAQLFGLLKRSANGVGATFQRFQTMNTAPTFAPTKPLKWVPANPPVVDGRWQRSRVNPAQLWANTEIDYQILSQSVADVKSYAADTLKRQYSLRSYEAELDNGEATLKAEAQAHKSNLQAMLDQTQIHNYLDANVIDDSGWTYTA